MAESKTCKQCGAEFFKPGWCGSFKWNVRRFCSNECRDQWAVENPGIHVNGPKFQTGRTRDTSTGKLLPNQPPNMIPCRICGEPTQYRGTERNHLYDMLHCKRPECVEASRLLKNERIKETALRTYASGERAKVRHGWKNVARVSVDEIAIQPWFESQGWSAQYRFNTDVHSYHLPRQFRLDFALPERRLYIEIDGDAHRLKRDRDARRDEMMGERGWKGLRVPASLVRSDLNAAVHLITSWIDSLELKVA